MIRTMPRRHHLHPSQRSAMASAYLACTFQRIVTVPALGAVAIVLMICLIIAIMMLMMSMRMMAATTTTPASLIRAHTAKHRLHQPRQPLSKAPLDNIVNITAITMHNTNTNTNTNTITMGTKLMHSRTMHQLSSQLAMLPAQQSQSTRSQGCSRRHALQLELMEVMASTGLPMASADLELQSRRSSARGHPANRQPPAKLHPVYAIGQTFRWPAQPSSTSNGRTRKEVWRHSHESSGERALQRALHLSPHMGRHLAHDDDPPQLASVLAGLDSIFQPFQVTGQICNCTQVVRKGHV